MSENESKRGLWELILLGVVVALFAYQIMKPQPQSDQARTPQTSSQENPQTPSQGNPQTADLSPLVGEWHSEIWSESGEKSEAWLNFQPNGTVQGKWILTSYNNSTVTSVDSNTMEGSYQRTGEKSYAAAIQAVCDKTCKYDSTPGEFTLNSSTELLMNKTGRKFRKIS